MGAFGPISCHGHRAAGGSLSPGMCHGGVHVPCCSSTVPISRRCSTTMAAASSVQGGGIVDGMLDFFFPPTEPHPSELGWRTDFSDKYTLKGRLGRGSFGEVRLAVCHKSKCQEYAIKTMQKVRGFTSREASLRKIKREARLMRLAQRSPGVVHLVDCFEEQEVVHLVTEVCHGGDLKRHVEQHGPLDESTLAHVACEVLKIVADCHALGIVYADVKPANFCLVGDGPSLPSGPELQGRAFSGRIKAIDFGCSQLFGPVAGRAERLSKRTGTLAFMAPEIFDQDFSNKVDVWSAGIMLYWLFSGRLPYWEAGAAPSVTCVDDMAALARGARIPLEGAPWSGMSPAGLDFLRGCLARDEAQRLSVGDALSHPWIATWVDQEDRNAQPGVAAGKQRVFKS